MSLALTYARREMRAGLAGFYVFIACLVLGVAAIAAVQSLSRAMQESLLHDGRYILGGDVAVRTLYQPATQEQLDFMRKELGEVSRTANLSTMVRTADGTRATMAELKAVDALYPLYGTAEFSDAAGVKLDKTPQEITKDGGAAVESGLLARLNIKLGDKIFIGEKDFTVTGVVTREPDRIGLEGFSLAPRIIISWDDLPATKLMDEGNLASYSQRIKTDKALTAEKMLDAKFPGQNWRIRDYTSSSPRIERYINRLAFFLTLTGLTTLLVGGAGISNAVRGYLDGRMAHIATLKCLGASSGFVLRVFLLQVSFIAVLGTVIGLCIGAGAAYYASGLLTAKLSLTDLKAFYPDALALSATFGLLAALAFTLWPLGRAVKVSPAGLFRDAVAHAQQRPSPAIITVIALSGLSLALLAVASSADKFFAIWFTGGAAAAFVLLLGLSTLVKTILSKIKPRQPEARMAVANITRPGNVSTGILLSLGLGLSVLVAIALVEYNFSRLVNEDLSAHAPSFFFTDVQPDQVAEFERVVKSFPSAREINMTPVLRGRIVKVNGEAAEDRIKGSAAGQRHDWVTRSDRSFTYMAEPPPHGEMTAGKWWPKDYSGAPVVSISTEVADALDIGVGDTITANILGIEIPAKVMNIRNVDWSSFTMNFAVTFNPGALQDAPATYMATAIADAKDEEALMAKLATEIPNVTSIRLKDALEVAGTIIAAVAQAVRISAGVTLLAGALVLAGGIAAARRRHAYDAVILKVLGASRRRIFTAFLLEYGILSLSAALLASLIGAAAAWGAVKFIMDLPWKFSLLSLLGVATLCITITLLAGFSGTFAALRQKPATYLRNS
ncbi:MAG: ABC transporter permease [Alphaproteobacteria bacterium]